MSSKKSNTAQPPTERNLPKPLKFVPFIPGTHDAGCISQYGDVSSGYADCQDAKIIDQLKAGVRFFDLRVEDTNGAWEIYHAAYQYQTLWEVLIEIATFLNDHPRETVLTRITAGEAVDKDAFLREWPLFANVFEEFIWQVEGKVRADGVTPRTYAHNATGGDNDKTFGYSYNWPTLGEVRRKMVLFLYPDPLKEELEGHASGLGYFNNTTYPATPTDGSSIFQIINRDDFSNSDWGDKQKKDIDHIIQASGDLNPKALYVTGLNIGYAAGGSKPSTHAEVMNRYLLNQLNSDSNYLRKTGLVLMDYPGPGLLDSIIALNFRHATSSALIYDDFFQYALNLPFEDKIVSDSVASGVPIAKIWRRLVKERLPSTEFNTYIVTVPEAGSLNVSSSISPADKNVLAAAFKQGDSFQAIFESNRLPPKVTKNQVKQKLDALYAAGDFSQKTNPSYFKAGFDLAYPDHNWVVFWIQTANALPSAQFDFDENVVWESKFGASGIFSQTLIVAGSAKPEPAVESGVSHPAVVGQWDFNKGDLTATVGQDLVSGGGQEFFSPIPNWAAPAFPGGNGAGLAIFDSASGLEMTHSAAPNGGPSAARLNQWTLIMDLLLMSPDPGYRSLIQIDTLDNTTDGDLFISPEGGIGIDGIYHGEMENSKWYRVAITVDTTREQVMSKYIDGNLVGEQPIRTFNASAAGLSYSYSADRWSLMDKALLFGDDTGEAGTLQVSSIQLRNYKMSAAEVAALDGPSAAGIPNDAMTLSVEGRGLVLEEENGFERMNDDTLLKDHVKVSWDLRHQLQQSNNPGGPWSDVPDEQTIESPRYFKTEGKTQQFFRLRSR